MALNQIVATVSIVIQLKGGAVIGSASGFFYGRADNLFLVTNQHVMRNDRDEMVPDMLRLRLHTDPNDIGKSAELNLPLYAEGNRLWKTHPKHANADIALIKLDAADIKKRFFMRAWSKESFLPDDLPLPPGEDVFVIGYPLSFHDLRHNFRSFGTP